MGKKKKVKTSQDFWLKRVRKVARLSEDLNFNIFSTLPEDVLLNMETHTGIPVRHKTIGFKFEGELSGVGISEIISNSFLD